MWYSGIDECVLYEWMRNARINGTCLECVNSQDASIYLCTYMQSICGCLGETNAITCNMIVMMEMFFMIFGVVAGKCKMP